MQNFGSKDLQKIFGGTNLETKKKKEKKIEKEKKVRQREKK